MSVGKAISVSTFKEKLLCFDFSNRQAKCISVRQFFGEQVATAMEHYKRLGVRGMDDCDSTVKFIRRINVLIDAMNSNTRSEGLKAEADQEEVLLDPPVCAKCNKTHAENTPCEQPERFDNIL